MADMPDSIRILALSSPRIGELGVIIYQVLNLIAELAVHDCNTCERRFGVKPDPIVV